METRKEVRNSRSRSKLPFLDSFQHPFYILEGGTLLAT